MNPRRKTKDPSEEKRLSKPHTVFREKIQRGTPYLFKNIICHPENNLRFICLACKEAKKKNYEGYCENLRIHLMNKAHEDTLKTEELKKECQQSIKFLERGTDVSQDLDVKDESDKEETKEGATSGMKSKSKDQVQLKFDIVSFLIMNNLPFNLANKLINYTKHLVNYYDLDTIESTKIYDQQVSKIASKCIGLELKESNLKLLDYSPFSISADECTDKAGKSFLALSARCFASNLENEPEDRLLALFELGESSSGKVLHDLIENFLFNGINKDLKQKNFMGISSDHAPNMISGGKKGLGERLKANFPHIFVIHDLAHAFNLIMEAIIDQFPSETVKIITKISAHFSYSSQRKAKLLKIQKEMGFINTLEILRYKSIRWSSLQDCLDRIIALIQPLRSYFDKYGTSEEKNFLSRKNESYLKLLSCLLKKLYVYNKFFQNEKLLNKDIIMVLKECLILFGESFVKFDFGEITSDSLQKLFTFIYDIPFNDESQSSQYVMNLLEFSEKFFEDHGDLRDDFETLDEDLKKDI